MKKKILTIIILVIFILSIFYFIDYIKPNDELLSDNNQIIDTNIQDTEEYYFIGKIIDINSSGIIIIEPNEDDSMRKSSDKIRIKNNTNEVFEIGAEVKVKYNGMIAESYPAQIDAMSIEKYARDKLLSSYKDIKSLPEEYNLESAVSDECFVISYNQRYNENLLDEFIKDVENKTQAFIRMVQPTIEGDEIITDIKYTIDGKIEICCDSTRDKFSSQENRTYKYYTFNNMIKCNSNNEEILYAFNGEELTEEMIYNGEAYYIISLK